MNDPLRYSILFADAGVPMIFLTFPAMVILLVPVVLVEAYLYKKWLKITAKEALGYSTWSNIASMVLGTPVAWAATLLVEMFVEGFVFRFFEPQIESLGNSPLANLIFLIVGSAWLPPQTAPWVIPAACLVLLIPFFFASYWTEYQVMRLMMRRGVLIEAPRETVRTAVRNANLVSYTAIFVGTSVWLVWEYLHRVAS